MASWSADNATKAYIRTLKMGKRAKEPDVGEFVSALAAGNNARLMVVAWAGTVEAYTMQALVAAAHQTGGRVVCILRGYIELRLSIEALGRDASDCIEFVVGEAKPLLLSDYKDADFVLIDCNMRNIHQGIFQAGGRQNDAIVLGYNAFSQGSWRSFASNAHLLPIGEGLSVSRIRANAKNLGSRKSHWVVKVDKFTGEEHVLRVRLPEGKCQAEEVRCLVALLPNLNSVIIARISAKGSSWNDEVFKPSGILEL